MKVWGDPTAEDVEGIMGTNTRWKTTDMLRILDQADTRDTAIICARFACSKDMAEIWRKMEADYIPQN